MLSLLPMVYLIYDSTEEAIQKMIEANERIAALGIGDGNERLMTEIDM